jgi:hypothetical protein
MKKVLVIKNNEVVQFVNFETQEMADAWIEMLASTAAWGFPERWVADHFAGIGGFGESALGMSDAQKALAIDSRVVESDFGSYTEYKFAAEYTVEIEDITAQVAEQKAIQKYLARIQFGQRLMAELAAKNKAALDTQSMTQEQVLALKQALGPVKDFLTEGSLGFALAAIQSLNSIPLELKNYFVSLIEDYLLKET